MESDSKEEEPSVLEYARLYGLCIDHTTEPLRTGELPAVSDAAIDLDFQAPLGTSINNAINELTKERLVINKDAALLLKSVYELQEASTNDSFAIEKRAWILNLKLEAPLLKTDSEVDLLSFGSAALPSLKDPKIPFEITDEERDEGLEWPSRYFAYPAQCDEQAKTEKIAISKEVLLYLQDAVRDTYLPEDSEMIKAESLRYKPNAPPQITPPLLPLSPPMTPYIPSSPANRLPLPTDSSDSLTAELRDVEGQIIGIETLDRDCSDSNDLMLLDLALPPQLSLLDEYQELPAQRSKVEDLKVEGPLTPPIFSTSPMKKLKCVSFADTIHEFIPDDLWAGTLTNEDSNSSIDFDECFRDLEPLAVEARKRVENEKLSGPDTIARVEVPEVDFSLPIAPWNEYSQSKGDTNRSGVTELELQTKFLLRIQHDDLRSVAIWHGLAALERELRWSIFTINVGSIDINEQLHGETDLKKIFTKSSTGNIATSFSQVWKREGLRVLDDDDDEEEEEVIETEELDEDRDIETLIRKRKSKIEEEAAEMHHKRRRQCQNLPQVVNKSMTDAHLSKQDHSKDELQAQQSGRRTSKVSTAPNDDLMFGGFSVTTALHKFMETRGKIAGLVDTRKDKQLAPENASALAMKTVPDNSNLQLPNQLMMSKKRALQTKEGSYVEQQPLILLPNLPQIPGNLPPCSFIVSSVLLNRRSFMKQIDSLYPEADMVYRDYNLPHSHAQEADFILSPSTGLIFTTLQQVKQRALPGQPKRAPVKDRMNSLYRRYERLIVMIGEGLSNEMENFGSSRPEDHRNKEILTEFENFASELEGEVLVKYVRGGEQALARFSLMEMIKYGLPHGSPDIGNMKPLVVETSWEVFLRQAGLNPYAAQVVIALLKQPVNIRIPASSNLPHHLQNQNTVSISGLPAFLMMDVEDRIHYFQAFMGGSRVLKRVSGILDQEWISAAHSFQL